ncbi:MAG: hypothetical protein K6L81_01875 [Agarilytica sp.]
MVAAVSDLNLVHAADRATWLSEIVGGSDRAMPSVSEGSFNGIDGAIACQALFNNGTDLSEDQWYSAWTGDLGTAFDCSAIDSGIFIHYRNNLPGYTAVRTARFILFSGVGNAEYAYWEYDATGALRNGLWWLLGAHGAPDFQTGGYNSSNIRAIGMALLADGDGFQFGFQIYLDQSIHFNGAPRFGDTGVPAQVGMQDYYDLLNPFSGEPYHSLLVKQAGAAFEFAMPFRVEAADYRDSEDVLVFGFKRGDGVAFREPAAGFYHATYAPPVGGSHIINNASAVTTSDEFDLILDSTNSGSTIAVSSILAAGVRDVSLHGSGLSVSGGTISAPRNIAVGGDSELEVRVISPDNPLLLDGDLAFGSSLRVDDPIGDAIVLGLPPGDYSHIQIILNVATVISHSAAAGTYILDVSNTAQTEFDTDTANNVIFEVPVSANGIEISSSTGGGDVSVVLPPFQPQLTLTGLKNPSEVRVHDSASGLEISGAENATTGVYTDQLPVGTLGVNISVLSLNYRNTYLFDIDTSTDRTIPVQQIADRQYQNQ